MKARPQMSLAEMATRAAGINGRLVCPQCHCADFKTYGKQPSHVVTVRYKQCRHCGYKMITEQQPERFVRGVGGDDSSIESDLV